MVRETRGRNVGMVVAMTIFISAVGAFFYRDQADQLRNDRLADLEAIARLKVDQIRAWRSERLGDALMESTGLIRWLALEGLEGPDREEARALVRETMERSRAVYGGRNRMLVGLDGTVRVAGNPDHPAAIDGPARALMDRAVVTKGPVFGEL